MKNKTPLVIILSGILLLLSVNLVSSAFWEPNLDSELIFYYELEETSGINVLNSNNGTMNGTANHTSAQNWDIAGKVNSGIIFNGSVVAGGWINTTLEQECEAQTFCAWVNRSLDVIDNRVVVMSGGWGANIQGFIVSVDQDGSMKIHTGDDVGNVVSLQIEEDLFLRNDWTHFCYTWDGLNVSYSFDVYINGLYNFSVPIFDWAGTSEIALAIGSDNIAHSPNFNGTIDEAGYWARELTASEIANLYNSGDGVEFRGSGIDLNEPIDTFNTTSSDITFNCSAKGTDIMNMTLIIDGINNLTTFNASAGVTDFSLETTETFADGYYNWSCRFSDLLGNQVNSTETYHFNISNFVINSQTYSDPVYSSAYENFLINVSWDNVSGTSILGQFSYDGTYYDANQIGTGSTILFNVSLAIPETATIVNATIFWNITIDSVDYLTIPINISVLPITPLEVGWQACSAGLISAFNLTSLIEANLTAVNFTSVNYNLLYGLSGNSSSNSIYGSLTNIPNINICINATSNYSVGYGEIQYEVSGYSNRRYYIFDTTRITNVTIENNLYSLETTDSTAFQVTATDTTLAPYENHYLTLLRWYPDLNTYRIVDMGRTDEKGQTVVNVKTNDVDYRLGLYQSDGTLVKLLEPIRMICQTTPCVYSLIVDLEEIDLTTFLNIESSLTFDATTEIFTYIFNDPSQETTLINLTVWQDFGDRDSIIICSATSTDFTGVLTCDISAYSGQVRAEVWRESSPRIMIAQLLKSLRDTILDQEGGRTISLLIGFILVVSFALMGVVSPILMVILGVVGLLPLIILGVFDKATFLIIGCIAGIILHFLRRIQ